MVNDTNVHDKVFRIEFVFTWFHVVLNNYFSDPQSFSLVTLKWPVV